MAQQELSEKQMKQINELFKQFDADGSGQISTTEVKELLEKFGLKLSLNQVTKLVKLVDDDSNGEIDFGEFIDLVKLALFGQKPRTKEQKAQERSLKAPAPTPPTGGTIYVYLGGNLPKYLDLLVQSIKFLRRKVPNALVGVISPPGDDVQPNLEAGLSAIDSNLVNNIKYVEGTQHFDDWGNTQRFLDISLFAQEYDPIVVVDVDTVLLQDLTPFVTSFVESGKNFAFLSDYVFDYPNFKDNWDGSPVFIPQSTFQLYRALALPTILQPWQDNWKEWITPAPFVQKKDPARFYKLSRITIAQYSLAQTLQKSTNFSEDVKIIQRNEFKWSRNLAIEPQKAKKKFLEAGSSFSNEGKTNITIGVQSGHINDPQDVGGNKGDPYVTVKVGGWEKQTKTVPNTQDPVWGEQFVFEDSTYADASNIQFTLWDYDALTKNDEIGTATLDLVDKKTHEQGQGTQHYTLPVVDKNGVEQGQLEIDGEFYVEQLPDDDATTRSFVVPDTGPKNAVLTIISGKIYNKHDATGEDDGFVVVKIGGVTKKTKVIDNNQNPVWNEEITFEDVSNEVAANVELQIWDKDKFTKDDLIGSATLDLTKYINKKQRISLPFKNEAGEEEAVVEIDAILASKQ